MENLLELFGFKEVMINGVGVGGPLERSLMPIFKPWKDILLPWQITNDMNPLCGEDNHEILTIVGHVERVVSNFNITANKSVIQLITYHCMDTQPLFLIQSPSLGSFCATVQTGWFIKNKHLFILGVGKSKTEGSLLVRLTLLHQNIAEGITRAKEGGSQIHPF